MDGAGQRASLREVVEFRGTASSVRPGPAWHPGARSSRKTVGGGVRGVTARRRDRAGARLEPLRGPQSLASSSDRRPSGRAPENRIPSHLKTQTRRDKTSHLTKIKLGLDRVSDLARLSFDVAYVEKLAVRSCSRPTLPVGEPDLSLQPLEKFTTLLARASTPRLAFRTATGIFYYAAVCRQAGWLSLDS